MLKKHRLAILLSATVIVAAVGMVMMFMNRDLTDSSGPNAASDADYVMTVVKGSNSPVIGKMHPGSADNGHGYENGHVIKLPNGEYHMLITEMFKDGKVGGQGYWSPARIGHWISTDADNWTRLGTIVEGNAILGHKKENTWSPSWYWNERENCWNIFWRGSNSVFRYKSETSGEAGINGPYVEANQIYPPLAGDAKWWDEVGFASFSNVFVGKDGNYYSFYGVGTKKNDEWNWYNGLAYADNIDAIWSRDPSKKDPDFNYSENPYVYIYDDVYFCVYDDLSDLHSIGYGYSFDGVNWVRKTLDLTGHTPWVHQNWYVQSVRTPCSLIKEDDGTYTILFTGYNAKDNYFDIGKISVKIETKKLKKDDAEVFFPGDMNNWKPNAGKWAVECGEYSQRDTGESNYNSVIAGRTWKNAIVEAELRCVDKPGILRDGWAGIHIRKTNPDDGPEDSGYLVYLSANGHLYLYKGSTMLKSYNTKASPYMFRKIKVEAKNNNIKVYFEEAEKPCIDVNDDTYKEGYVSVNTSKSHWHFKTIKVK